MIRDDVRCSEVVTVLTDYFDGALPADERVALEQHLLFCEGCVSFVEQLRTTVGLTGRLVQADVPTPVMDRLLQMFGER